MQGICFFPNEWVSKTFIWSVQGKKFLLLQDFGWSQMFFKLPLLFLFLPTTAVDIRYTKTSLVINFPYQHHTNSSFGNEVGDPIAHCSPSELLDYEISTCGVGFYLSIQRNMDFSVYLFGMHIKNKPSLLNIATLSAKVVEYVDCTSVDGVRPPHSQWVLCIWLRGSSPRALGNVKYPFIAITPRSTLTQNNSTWVKVSAMGPKELFKYLVRIIIISYLKPYSCEQIIYTT